MLTTMRLRYLWVVLASGIVLISIRPINIWIYQIVGMNVLNRWVHFLAYAVVVSIALIAWRGRLGVSLSLIVGAISLVLELWSAFISRSIVGPRIAGADLFGIAAGILLGLNLRMMLHSPVPGESVRGANHVDFNVSSS